MVAPLIKRLFDPYIELDLRVWENFEKLGETCRFPKETILKEAHSTEKYLTLLLEGSGGCLLWNRHNFVCTDLAQEQEFLCDFASFTTRLPTPLEIRLFEDSRLFRVSHAAFQQTFLPGNFGDKVTKEVVQSSYFDKQQQQIDLLTKSAKERYLELLETRKGLDRIPLKYLASYLGITPQSLSRIRAGKIGQLPYDKPE